MKSVELEDAPGVYKRTGTRTKRLKLICLVCRNHQTLPFRKRNPVLLPIAFENGTILVCEPARSVVGSWKEEMSGVTVLGFIGPRPKKNPKEF